MGRLKGSKMINMTSQYGMLIDLNRCTGCNACIVACKQENDLPPGLDAPPGTEGIAFIRVETIGPQGEYPELSMYFQPIPCMHCANPPCLEACPVEAISKQADGLVLIDRDACTACEACVEACPYDAVCMDAEKETARKCDLCAHRIQQNQQPACVAACNAGAMIFGDMADPASNVSKLIKKHAGSCFVLKPELKTEPSILYLLHK